MRRCCTSYEGERYCRSRSRTRSRSRSRRRRQRSYSRSASRSTSPSPRRHSRRRYSRSPPSTYKWLKAVADGTMVGSGGSGVGGQSGGRRQHPYGDRSSEWFFYAGSKPSRPFHSQQHFPPTVPPPPINARYPAPASFSAYGHYAITPTTGLLPPPVSLLHTQTSKPRGMHSYSRRYEQPSSRNSPPPTSRSPQHSSPSSTPNVCCCFHNFGSLLLILIVFLKSCFSDE